MDATENRRRVFSRLGIINFTRPRHHRRQADAKSSVTAARHITSSEGDAIGPYLELELPPPDGVVAAEAAVVATSDISEASALPSTEEVDVAAPDDRRSVVWQKLGGINILRPRQKQQAGGKSMDYSMAGGTDAAAGDDRRGIWSKLGINFIRPRRPEQEEAQRNMDSCTISSCTADNSCVDSACTAKVDNDTSIEEQIENDISETERGDANILVQHIGRDAAVNAAVLVTSILSAGDAAALIGAYVAGGTLSSKRLFDGILSRNEREVTKSLAVIGCATGASIGGQAAACALMIGIAGASLPVAGVVAFGVGCCSGGAAGALSEWTVDRLYVDKRKKDMNIIEKG